MKLDRSGISSERRRLNLSIAEPNCCWVGEAWGLESNYYSCPTCVEMSREAVYKYFDMLDGVDKTAFSNFKKELYEHILKAHPQLLERKK